jgi:hypothetical protein
MRKERYSRALNDPSDPLTDDQVNWLRKQLANIEERLQNSKQARVADIVFSYDNGRVISLLAAKGKAISDLKRSKEERLNSEINQLLTEYNLLTEPCDAFVTFEEEDSKLLAVKYGKKRGL